MRKVDQKETEADKKNRKERAQYALGEIDEKVKTAPKKGRRLLDQTPWIGMSRHFNQKK